MKFNRVWQFYYFRLSVGINGFTVKKEKSSALSDFFVFLRVFNVQISTEIVKMFEETRSTELCS